MSLKRNKEEIQTSASEEINRKKFKGRDRPRLSLISKRRASSSLGLCLFCRGLTSNIPLLFQDIPGAVQCLSLQKELQSYFILKELLNIPVSFLIRKNNKIDKGNENEEEILFKEAFQFQVCEDCFKEISNGWDLNQNILKLGTQLNDIKFKLKEKIRKSMITTGNDDNCDSDKIVNEIRSYCYRNKGNKSVLSWGNEGILEKDPLEEECGSDNDPIPRNLDDNSDEEWKPYPKKDQACLKSTTPVKMGVKSFKKKRIWKKRPSRWPWKCSQCPTKFKTEVDLQSHKAVHEQTTNPLLICNFCNFPCETEEDVETHKFEKHLRCRSGQRKIFNFHCKICKLPVRFHYQLEKHVKEKHPDLSGEECGLRSLTCKVCGLQSGSISAASLHTKMFHPELYGAQPELPQADNQFVECKECGEKFDNLIRLQFHEHAHLRERKQELNYTCEICGKAFKWKSRLQQHVLIHSLAKNWICSICGLDFTYKNALNRHTRKYHPSNKSEKSTPQMEKAPPPNPPPEFKCNVCNLTMSSALKTRHIKSHKNAFAHKCDLCERTYMTFQALKRHKVINHSDKKAKCKFCNKEFPHRDYAVGHQKFCRVAIKLASSSSDPHPPINKKGKSKKKKIKPKDLDKESDNPSIPIPIIVKADDLIPEEESFNLMVTPTTTISTLTSLSSQPSIPILVSVKGDNNPPISPQPPSPVQFTVIEPTEVTIVPIFEGEPSNEMWKHE